MNDRTDEFAAIPILMELVADEPPAANDALPAPLPVAESLPTAATQDIPPPRRALRREDQQPLFADLAPETAPRATPPPKRAAKPGTGLQRMAEELLRARAPAIVEELTERHARELSSQLRERLRTEMAGILAELAAQDPPGEPGQGR